MSIFISKPQPLRPGEHLTALFLEHAKGLKVKRLFCPQCQRQTTQFVEVRDGRCYRLCDACGAEQMESA